MKIIIPSLLLGLSMGGILLSIIFVLFEPKALVGIFFRLTILFFVIALMPLAGNISKKNLSALSVKCLVFVWFLIASIFIFPVSNVLFLTYCLLLAGIAMNTIVVFANNDVMPVYTNDPDTIEQAQQSKRHFDAKGQKASFACLADWIPFSGTIISPGDVLIIGSGIFLSFFFLIYFCLI